MTTFSIIVPTYNSGDTVERTLDSISAQTFDDYEVLVMDGLSTDNTLQIVRERQNPKFKLFSEPDTGVYNAMNKGVKIATGEWLFFLGSDDKLYDNTVLERVSTFLKTATEKVVYGNVIVGEGTSWAKTGAVYDGEFNLQKILKKNIAHQAIFYHRFVFEKIGEYNEEYKICADWDFNLRAFSTFKFQHMKDLVVAKFKGGGLSTKLTDTLFLNDLDRNIIVYFYGKLHQKEFKSKCKSIIRFSKEKLHDGEIFKAIRLYVTAQYLKLRYR